LSTALIVNLRKLLEKKAPGDLPGANGGYFFFSFLGFFFSLFGEPPPFIYASFEVKNKLWRRSQAFLLP
jgi:hypothetical protein